MSNSQARNHFEKAKQHNADAVQEFFVIVAIEAVM